MRWNSTDRVRLISSCCVTVLGCFLFIFGFLSRFVGETDQSDDEHFNRMPTTIATITMVIGGLLIGGSIIACVYYSYYLKSRSKAVSNNAVHNHAVISGPTEQLPITGVHYPTQRNESEHEPDYQSATLHTAYFPSALTNVTVI